MSPLRICTRRLRAGVDRRFDDVANETFELIRLAERGHIFEICLAEPRIEQGHDKREKV
jgi:hypothetical protein